jgi:hypothetical protein
VELPQVYMNELLNLRNMMSLSFPILKELSILIVTIPCWPEYRFPEDCETTDNITARVDFRDPVREIWCGACGHSFRLFSEEDPTCGQAPVHYPEYESE